MTKGRPLTETLAASVRGAGRPGPSAQVPRLPSSVVVVWSTEAVTPVGVVPPTRNRSVPPWKAPASARPSGSDTSGGEACQGTQAPAGGGQGRSPLEASHRLTMLITL